jgi:hypothetical protein
MGSGIDFHVPFQKKNVGWRAMRQIKQRANDMLRNRLKTLTLVLVGIALFSVAVGGWLLQAHALPADADKPKEDRPAKEIAHKQYDFDDMGQILRIARHSGRVTLNPGRLPAVSLVIEFYFDGQKQERVIEGVGNDCINDPAAHGKPIDFCIQTVDLDYVLLGDGKKDHCRVLFKTEVVGSGFASGTQDISKDFFDFSKAGSGGGFTAAQSSGNLIPLRWMLTDTNETHSGQSVADVVRQNPKGKLAILYLRLTDQK